MPHETTTKVLYNINKRFVDGEMQRKSSEESPAEDVLSPTGQSKTSPYIQDIGARNSRVLARHQARMAAKRKGKALVNSRFWEANESNKDGQPIPIPQIPN